MLITFVQSVGSQEIDGAASHRTGRRVAFRLAFLPTSIATYLSSASKSLFELRTITNVNQRRRHLCGRSRRDPAQRQSLPCDCSLHDSAVLHANAAFFRYSDACAQRRIRRVSADSQVSRLQLTESRRQVLVLVASLVIRAKRQSGGFWIFRMSHTASGSYITPHYAVAQVFARLASKSADADFHHPPGGSS